MTEPLIPRAPDADPARAELIATAKREIGFAPSVLNYLGACPWLGHAQIAFFTARPVYLSVRVCELVPYVVAVDRKARHLTGSLAAFLRFAGYPDAELHAIETGDHARFARSEAAAFDHVVALARGHGRNTLAKLTDYTPSARAELTAHAALVVFGAYIATPIGVPPDPIEAFERGLIAKVFRPLIRWRIHAARKLAGRPATDDHGAVFASTLALVAGSPPHELARDVLASAWRSPILPVADKAGIVAVVADALGAPALAAEARALGATEQFAAYARATASGDGLYPAAAALTLTRPELLEVIGIAALANALARVHACLVA